MLPNFVRWPYQTMSEAARQLPTYFTIQHRFTGELEVVKICHHSNYVVRTSSFSSGLQQAEERSFHILDLLNEWELPDGN